VVVGLVSDLLQPQLSAAASLRFALMMATVTFVWASVHFLIAARFDREKDEVAALNKLG
jgi:low temperature requirement protein LtrA